MRSFSEGTTRFIGFAATLVISGCAPSPSHPTDLFEADAGRPDATGLDGASCRDGCIVDGGVCVRAGTVNPHNPCEVCEPTANRRGFSPNDGARCEDGAFCTVDDSCRAGVCVAGSLRSCDDGISCTGADHCDEAADRCLRGATTCAAEELCDLGAGSCESSCAGCNIDGLCVPEGQRNPSNSCETCDTSRRRDGWSAADGTSCDDGAFCTTDDTCDGTVCRGDGIACNGRETCEESTDRCSTPATPACPDGSVCSIATDSCETTCLGCSIGDVCYAGDAPNPANPCEVCDVAISREHWSPRDGGRCDDGAFCTQYDTCRAGRCVGELRNCDDSVSCNGTETCDESIDMCTPGIRACEHGSLCHPDTDTCESACGGCVVSGSCVAEGATNPMNPCEVCDPARAAVGWSDNAGVICEDGDFCTVGDRCLDRVCRAGEARTCDDGTACNGVETCDESADECVPGVPTCGPRSSCDPTRDRCVACTGCLIDGMCYADGAGNLENPCEVCDASAAATTWSLVSGRHCDDGNACTEADVCVAGVCGGRPLECDDGLSCNGVETCNPSSGRCESGPGTCSAWETCNAVTGRCESSCHGCVIGGVCYSIGERNPSNSCEVCRNPADTHWSLDVGISCNDGSPCTIGDTCGVSGCVGIARLCGDGIACNGVETCNGTTGACMPGVPTCPVGYECNVDSDTCQ